MGMVVVVIMMIVIVVMAVVVMMIMVVMVVVAHGTLLLSFENAAKGAGGAFVSSRLFVYDPGAVSGVRTANHRIEFKVRRQGCL